MNAIEDWQVDVVHVQAGGRVLIKGIKGTKGRRAMWLSPFVTNTARIRSSVLEVPEMLFPAETGQYVSEVEISRALLDLARAWKGEWGEPRVQITKWAGDRRRPPGLGITLLGPA